MEQKQLTAQICAAYFGCEVQVGLIKKSIGVMVGVDTEYICVSDNTDRLSRVDGLLGTKLVLRRLESLTEDEAVKVLEIEGEAAGNSEMGKKIVLRRGKYSTMMRKSVDYLRSIKIDIGYGDIPSLIDAGLAVEKK